MTPASKSSRNPTPATRGRFLPARHRAYKYIALIAGIIAIARSAATVTTFNHTIDELSHVAGCVGLYESGRNIYMFEHPPLQRLVVGGALKLAGAEYPPARGLTAVQPRNDANTVGEAILLDTDRPDAVKHYWKVLAVGRCANLLFSALLLLYTYRLGGYLASPLAGMLACIALSLDPTVLGHGPLITTDVPAAAGFVAATFYALRFIARPIRTRAIAAGIALGLGVACKFTCVMLIPPILLLIAIRAFRHARRRRDLNCSAENVSRDTGVPPVPAASEGGLPPGIGDFSRADSDRPLRPTLIRRFFHHVPRFRYFTAISVIAFICLWATYLFKIGPISNQKHFDQEKTWLAIPQWAKNAPIPMPAMPLGLMFMATLGKYGFPSYFNGDLSLAGHLGYFPAVLAFKLPAGIIAAAALGLLAFIFIRRPRRPIILLSVILPASLLLISASTGKLQIGVRHILPVLPFIYLLAAVQLRRGIGAIALIALIAVAAIETAPFHPDYLAFYNRIAGGPARGADIIADSNIDYGQDVARLAEYLKTVDRPYAVKVSGARIPALFRLLGINPASRMLTPNELLADSADGDTDGDANDPANGAAPPRRERLPGTDPVALAAHPHGLLAISVNCRIGFEDFRREGGDKITRGQDWSWVRKYPLVKRIGWSIEVYDLDAPANHAN